MKRALALALTVALAPAFADEDPGFELVRGAAPTIKVRQSAALSLSIVPHAGHRLLAGGPVIVRLRGEGVRLERPVYHRDEAVDPRADVPRFELGFTAEHAGPAHVWADCTFYLCRGDKCRPVETTAAFDLAVAQ